MDYQGIRKRWKLDVWKDYILKGDNVAERLSQGLKDGDVCQHAYEWTSWI